MIGSEEREGISCERAACDDRKHGRGIGVRLRRHGTERDLRHQLALRRPTVLRLLPLALVAHLRHAYDRDLRVIQGSRPWVGRCGTFSLLRVRTNRSRLAATVRGSASAAVATASLAAWCASSTRLTMAPGQSTLIGRLRSRLANLLRRSLKIAGSRSKIDRRRRPVGESTLRRRDIDRACDGLGWWLCVLPEAGSNTPQPSSTGHFLR